ncbi:neurofilament heavy polypeptide-like isoform X2 [Battus philenor]|uniref:neurofilament heavy polypeptide-like isoform X2 n=1 Tax=Battus philenor TaxID=42288 RepID=UPI0035CFDA8A
MSDNEDLLGDDLGDHSLADYNLGNEEEEQLLADDYDNSTSQNVPTSVAVGYNDGVDIVPTEYPSHSIEYTPEPTPYAVTESECVVPNISVEVPAARLPEHSSYAPYPEPPAYDTEHAVVPPAIPAAPVESPQIVPSEVTAPLPNGDLGARERFTTERPMGAQRMPQVRDIPDSLDKVYVPRGGFPGRGRNSWRNPHYRSPHPYRRNNTHRGNFTSRSSFPPPQSRPIPRSPSPQIRPAIPEIRPDLPPQQMAPELSPERVIIPPDLPNFRPVDNRFPQNFPRFPPFRPNEELRPFANFEPKPAFPYQPYPRFPTIRGVVPSGIGHLPQVTIRQHVPGTVLPKVDKFPPKMILEQEVRMLPMHLPANIPPGGLAGKKVLINPHFKGNFQPPVEGLPTYIPTRIQKSPPLSPTLENKFGPIKDIDDAAERFIAEQRNALARAASRKIVRRSPQSEDDELLRRQEEFINANRAGLRRRMRSPSPVRRSPSPRRSPPRRTRTNDVHDEESEYRRRLREQESLRERVLRAKEVRRRKNAVALHKQLQDKDREKQEKDAAIEASKLENQKPANLKPAEATTDNNPTSTQPDKPDTTRKSPEKVDFAEKVEKIEPIRERSPVKEVKDDAEVNSTCENLTPPREKMPQKEKQPSLERDLTPPLPDAVKERVLDSDDELDLILDDIDGILSDDDDSGRFKEKKELEQPKQKPQVDLRTKLPPKAVETKAPRQKIVFNEKDDRKKKEKSPVRRTMVSSSTKVDVDGAGKKTAKAKQKSDTVAPKSRARITFDKKEPEKPKEEEKPKTQTFMNRRVILQRKSTQAPSAGIFSRAVRTALGAERARLVGKREEPQLEFGSDSEEEAPPPPAGNTAHVDNLPHGITDTRLKTLAGDDVQSLTLDKEERSAKISFKTTVAAENFRRKFNNKMVAASRLTVTLR